MPRQVSLICSDGPVLRLAQDLLRSQWIRVRHHHSGTDYLDNRDDADDCLIVDLHLPDMTALELLDQLARASLPIIVLAGNRDIPNAVAAIHAGATDVVERSRLSRDLVAQVHELFPDSLMQDHPDHAPAKGG